MAQQGHGLKTHLSDREREKIAFREIGTTGLRYYGGRIAEEWHPNLRGRRGAKVFREMRDNCAVIGSVAFATEEFLTDNGWTVHPHKSEAPEALMQAAFVEECFGDMEHTVESFLSEVSSKAWYGFGLHEKVFKVRGGESDFAMLRSKYSDGKIGIRKLPIRSQDTIEEWCFGPHGDVEGAIQQAPPDQKIVKLLSPELLHFRTTSAKNNPAGRSWLRNSYRSWFFLKRHQELEGIGASKDMAGVPVGRIPKEILDAAGGTDEAATRATVIKVLERMQRGEQEYVLWPSKTDMGGETGWDIGLMQSGGRRPMDLDGIIRRYESRILVSMLAEAVLLGQGGNTGSWSLASTQTHMFAVALGGLQKKIASVVNRDLIPELIRRNGWNPELAPHVEFADLESEDVIAKIGALVQAAGVGLIMGDRQLESHLRQKLGLPAKGDVSQGQLSDAMGEYGEAADAQNEADAGILQGIGPKADEEQQPDRPRQYLRARDVAQRWGVSPATVLKLIRNGKLQGTRIGSSVRVELGEVERYESATDGDGDGKPDDIEEQAEK